MLGQEMPARADTIAGQPAPESMTGRLESIWNLARNCHALADRITERIVGPQPTGENKQPTPMGVNGYTLAIRNDLENLCKRLAEIAETL